VPASIASAQVTVYSKATAATPSSTCPGRCCSDASITSASPTGYSTEVTAFPTSKAAV
jgi:hypothetical protein